MSTNPMILRHRAGAYRSPCGQVLRVLDKDGEHVFLVRCAPEEGDKMEGVDFNLCIDGKPSKATYWGAARPCAPVDREDPDILGVVTSFRTTTVFASNSPFVECIEHGKKVYVREGHVDASEEDKITVMISSLGEKDGCIVRAKEKGVGRLRWNLVPVNGTQVDGIEDGGDFELLGPGLPLGKPGESAMDNAGCAKAHVQTALGKSAWLDTRGSWEHKKYLPSDA